MRQRGRIEHRDHCALGRGRRAGGRTDAARAVLLELRRERDVDEHAGGDLVANLDRCHFHSRE